VIKEHLRKEIEMTKAEFSKLSGMAFIAGSFAFITILSGSDPLALPGSVISTLLLAAGMLGLRARYGEHAGSFGRNILLLGVIGPILLCIVIASMALMYRSGNLTDAEVEAKGLWILIFGGPAISLLGLTLFGLAALGRKPMARLNWLPAFAGIWYPVFYFFLAGYLFTHHGVYPGQYQMAFNIMHLMQFLALCVLGSFLVANTPQEMATA
jgi:hypothetical protein